MSSMGAQRIVSQLTTFISQAEIDITHTEASQIESTKKFPEHPDISASRSYRANQPYSVSQKEIRQTCGRAVSKYAF